MMKNYIRCYKCKKCIYRKRDLVTVALFFQILTYHGCCFEQELHELRFPLSKFLPLNTLFGKFLSSYTLCIGFILLLTDPSVFWLSMLCFLPIFYRFFSYWYIERYF
ncbi:permease [Bacillus sp. AFS018417]|nr:permease [Bacillus sp. AFS018417]